MVDWHYKRMDALAAISRRNADNLTLSESARELFLRSYYLANTLKHFGVTECKRPLECAFDAMCGACKEASLHQCDPSEASFHRCRLVVAQMS